MIHQNFVTHEEIPLKIEGSENAASDTPRNATNREDQYVPIGSNIMTQYNLESDSNIGKK